MKLTIPLSLLVLVLFADPALALRCGNRIVSDGDPMAKVLKYCGDPVSVQSRTVYRGGIPRSVSRTDTDNDGRRFSDEELLIHQRSVVEVIVEEWTYNFGPRKFMRLIRFENGLVTGVEKLGYGYLD